jgi:hypothetical protein
MNLPTKLHSPYERNYEELHALRSSSNTENSLFATYFQNIENFPSNLFGQLFNIVFGPIKWFIGLRWYVILIIIVVGSYLFFQLEYAVESRRIERQLKQKKKEGMEEYNNVERMKSILKQTDQERNRETENGKKHVSFREDRLYDIQEYKNVEKQDDLWNNINKFILRFYNLWILPLFYILFRNTIIHIT